MGRLEGQSVQPGFEKLATAWANGKSGFCHQASQGAAGFPEAWVPQFQGAFPPDPEASRDQGHNQRQFGAQEPRSCPPHPATSKPGEWDQ